MCIVAEECKKLPRKGGRRCLGLSAALGGSPQLILPEPRSFSQRGRFGKDEAPCLGTWPKSLLSHPGIRTALPRPPRRRQLCVTSSSHFLSYFIKISRISRCQGRRWAVGLPPKRGSRSVRCGVRCERLEGAVAQLGHPCTRIGATAATAAGFWCLCALSTAGCQDETPCPRVGPRG